MGWGSWCPWPEFSFSNSLENSSSDHGALLLVPPRLAPIPVQAEELRDPEEVDDGGSHEMESATHESAQGCDSPWVAAQTFELQRLLTLLITMTM